MATNSPTADAALYGAPLGEHRGSTVRRVFLSIIGVVVLAMGLSSFAVFISSSASDTGGKISGIFVGLLFIGAALYCFYTLFSWRGAHAQLFQNGFIISRAGKTLNGRWEDVASVKQQIVQQRYYGIPVWTSYRYDVALLNGDSTRINSGFRDAGKLGDAFQRLAANAQLPRAISAYQSGATVPFGKYSVSQAGISNGKDTLPWSDASHVAFGNGYVLVMRQGKKIRWASAPMAKVDNVYVFVALVNHIRGGGQ